MAQDFPEKYLRQDSGLKRKRKPGPDRVRGQGGAAGERGKYREGPLLLLDAVGDF